MTGNKFMFLMCLVKCLSSRKIVFHHFSLHASKKKKQLSSTPSLSPRCHNITILLRHKSTNAIYDAYSPRCRDEHKYQKVFRLPALSKTSTVSGLWAKAARCRAVWPRTFLASTLAPPSTNNCKESTFPS